MVKNQHYIPRFLMRNFSEDENKEYITTYLLNEKRIVPNASIKNQASKDYIYGKDQTIENIFQNIEDATAITFSKIIKKVKWIGEGLSDTSANNKITRRFKITDTAKTIFLTGTFISGHTFDSLQSF